MCTFPVISNSHNIKTTLLEYQHLTNFLQFIHGNMAYGEKFSHSMKAEYEHKLESLMVHFLLKEVECGILMSNRLQSSYLCGSNLLEVTVPCFHLK